MNVETSASVYSVVTMAFSETVRETLDRYLYDGSSIVSGHGDGGTYTYFIVRTTAWDVHDSEHGTSRDLEREAFYLANYQLERLASGNYGGILAGSKRDAEKLVAETLEVTQ